MISHDDVFKIGRIGKIHGVKGEVTFHFTDDVFDRTDADYLFLEVDGILVPFFFEEYRFRNDDTALVKFEGIDSAEKATELTGCDVFFARELVEDNDGELTWNEIVGFHITDAQTGKDVGEISGIDLSTINTLFEVVTPEGTSLLVPATDDFIDDIDREQRLITMRLPEGLLEL